MSVYRGAAKQPSAQLATNGRVFPAQPVRRQPNTPHKTKWGITNCYIYIVDPKIAQNSEKSRSEGVPDSDWILDAFRERPGTGPCGSNAVNSISNSLPADRPQVRFWSPFGLHFGSLLGSFCDFCGFRKVSKKASKIRCPKYQKICQNGLPKG